jgi:hypothetical protein
VLTEQFEPKAAHYLFYAILVEEFDPEYLQYDEVLLILFLFFYFL